MALTSAIQVTQQGLVLQGPRIQINSGSDIRVVATGTVETVAANLLQRVSQGAAINVSGQLTVATGAGTQIQAGQAVAISGAVVRFNGGNKPIATVGSGVALTQVTTGNPMLLSN